MPLYESVEPRRVLNSGDHGPGQVIHASRTTALPDASAESRGRTSYAAFRKEWGMVIACFLLACSRTAFGLGDAPYVETSPSRGAFPIVQNNSAAEIVLDTNDFPGVLIAGGNLRTDISRVTDVVPIMLHNEPDRGAIPILVGTLGRSEWIDRLVREHKLDVSPIAGKWESWLTQIVPRPFPGVSKALVICGSDQRGT